MAHEKQYTPKQAALAVLDKVGELLKKSELTHSILNKADGFKHTDTHAGHDIHVGESGGKWAHQYFKHGSGYVHGSNSGAIFSSKQKAVEGAKIKISANIRKNEIPTSQNETNEKTPLKKAEQPGKIHPKEKEQAPSDGVRSQTDPQHNPKEQAEGNNPLAGTTPTQVGPDGKNVPGFDEMQGHIKLAKFLGRMEHKRISKSAAPAAAPLNKVY